MHAKCQTFIEGALANTNRVVESIKKFPIYERKCPAIFHSRSQFKSKGVVPLMRWNLRTTSSKQFEIFRG